MPYSMRGRKTDGPGGENGTGRAIWRKPKGKESEHIPSEFEFSGRFVNRKYSKLVVWKALNGNYSTSVTWRTAVSEEALS